MLPGRVASAIRRHQVFEPGERVLVAVSGGPDSIALLAALRELLPSFPLHLTVGHFDHGWRAESAADAGFVEELADRWGYEFIGGRAVAEVARTEAAARDARYSFLRQAAAKSSSGAIALGHTRDDQVETLLLHLLRGSGARGLAGMRYRAGDLARPLLGVDRKRVEHFVASLGLTPRRDASNDDPRFARNRLRQVVLPAIDAFSPSARRLLAQTAEILAEEDHLLEQQVDALDSELRSDLPALRALPPAIQRRLVRRADPQMSFIETEAARRHQSDPVSPEPLPQLRISTCSCDPVSFRARDRTGHLDADRVVMPLTVSRRRPGDRMRPLGMAEAKRVQDLLVDAPVPRRLRDSLPIIRDQEEIVWIPSVSVAEAKRVTPQTRHQMHLEIVST
jgi:tRNA(Ile)-lysidine synthase